MPPSPATSQYPCTPPDGEFTMSIHVDFKPNCDWKVAAGTSTEPDVPVMRRVCARRPPSAAVRATTLTACNVPTLGYALWIELTGTLAVQSWFGLLASGTESPSSTTAGKVPAAVNPPVEEENSVRATAPFSGRTSPGVAATAPSLLA